jgi:hypothetical protein
MAPRIWRAIGGYWLGRLSVQGMQGVPNGMVVRLGMRCCDSAFLEDFVTQERTLWTCLSREGLVDIHTVRFMPCLYQTSA